MKIKSKIKNQKSKLRNSTIFNFKFLILNSRREGLTLVEVLIALTILAIGLLGVAMMQVTSISGNVFSREMAVATELGQDMFEKLLAMSYTDSALSSGDHPTQTDVNNGIAVGAGANNVVDERGLTTGPTVYTRIWSITDNQPATGMKTILVTVSWVDRQRQQAGLSNPQIQMTRVKVE